MALAMEREQFTCISLLLRARAVLADPEPMLARLVRGCIALAFTACVLAVACMHRFADAVKGGELNYTAASFALPNFETTTAASSSRTGRALPPHSPSTFSSSGACAD